MVWQGSICPGPIDVHRCQSTKSGLGYVRELTHAPYYIVQWVVHEGLVPFSWAFNVQVAVCIGGALW